MDGLYKKSIFRKLLSIIVVVTLLLSSFLTLTISIQAMTAKVKMSSKKVVLVKGKTHTIRLKNVREKVKWTVKNKRIVIIKKIKGKYKNKIITKALKVGKTVIIAKYKGKKYKTTVIVKDDAKKQANKTTIPVRDVSKLPDTSTITTEKNKEGKISVSAKYQDGVIKVVLNNNTSQQAVTGWSDWKLQKKEANDWKYYFPENSFTEAIEIVVYIEPGKSTSNRITFYNNDNRERLEKPLSSGTYKYIHYFNTKEGQQSAECEFEVE